MIESVQHGKPARALCKTAVAAFATALLSSPLTTLSFLQALDRPGNLLNRLAMTLPYAFRALLVGLLLIGFPAASALLAAAAIYQINAAWTPVAGAGLARSALFLALFSTLAALGIFAFGVL